MPMKMVPYCLVVKLEHHWVQALPLDLCMVDLFMVVQVMEGPIMEQVGLINSLSNAGSPYIIIWKSLNFWLPQITRM